jgi:signal-transduction protein with cAMP-binding, CBS, and nucleotidyltransferase domain
MATADDALDSIARTRPSMTRGSASLREVADVMMSASCSAVVISGRDGELHVVTERDIVRAIASGANPDNEWAVDVMSTDVRTLPPTATVRDAAQLMQDAVIRHVVVRDPGTPDDFSMVSIRDLLQPFLNSTPAPPASA